MPVDQRQADLNNWVQCYYPAFSGDFKAIGGDAGFRRYYRFLLDDKSFLAVDAPPKTERSEQFIAVANWMEQVSIRVPQVYRVDTKLGFLVVEDCGDLLLFEQLQHRSIDDAYRRSLSMVHQLQQQNRPVDLKLEDFDVNFMQRELTIFHDWLVMTHLGLTSKQLNDSGWSEFCDWLTQQIIKQPYAPMHRDFHSRNLLVHGDDCVTIDFQDMVWGPATYDLVSLLKDCYLVWPEHMTRPIAEDFFASSALLKDLPAEQAWTYYQLTGMQRHLKAAGIFARLHHRDHKSGYLAAIPDTLNYIVDVLADYPQWQALHHFIESQVLRGAINVS